MSIFAKDERLKKLLLDGIQFVVGSDGSIF
jgi:hypothetical protein